MKQTLNLSVTPWSLTMPLLHVVRMYSISKLTHPATAVEHALSCNFFHRAEKSLIVAGANVIRVFRLIPDVDPNKKERFA
ncbi:unnamed protein product, partial [Timema podura]|nr:unnamed protein product [Timema podura]